MRRIGIMGAMQEEIREICALLGNCTEIELGKRTFFIGTLHQHEVVVCASRWGKVAAAATASALIHKFGITELYFTGVAGGISPNAHVGDIIIAESLVQHDMDARPIFQRFEIPLLGISRFQADPKQLQREKEAIESAIQTTKMFQGIDPIILERFHIRNPKVHLGLIASGDRFFGNNREKKQLEEALPEVLCVEMEGAAVAQVCYEYEIPFHIFRTLSDSANDGAVEDFTAFIQQIAGHISANIISAVLQARIDLN